MVRDRVGQMFMIGFDGCHVSKELKEIVLHYDVGGVILFLRNINDPIQLANLCNDLQNLSPHMPLFVSIDQEGGRVSRLKDPFTEIPPPELFGRRLEKEFNGMKKEKERNPEFSYENHEVVALVRDLGRIVARELRTVGINMNLSPVLDVNTNPENPVIGDRSFGANPYVVSILGTALIKGFQENGVIATGKHFPGHGDTDRDSHRELPTVKQSTKRLKEVELRPFVTAIGGGLEAIMTAHVLYPAWDRSMPATLSSKILSDLLRRTLRFKGLILSDDMEMGAIGDRYSIEEATLNAIKAGVDVVLIGSNLEKQERAIQSTLRALNEGMISEARIEESIYRIENLKNKYLLPYRPIDYNNVKAVIGCKEHQEFAIRIQRVLPPS